MNKVVKLVDECSDICIGSRIGLEIAYNTILPILDNLTERRGICIDLCGITLDPACAIQAFVVPIKILQENQHRSNYIYFKVDSAETLFCLDKALESEDLIGMVVTDNKVQFIGKTSSIFDDVVKKMIRLGSFDDSMLPFIMDSSTNVCHKRLRKFIDSGIIYESVVSNGIKNYSVSDIIYI